MGLSERDEQDNLRGHPIGDLFPLVPTCPRCLTDLQDRDFDEVLCPYCGKDLRDEGAD